MSYKARDPEPWLTVKKAIEVFGKYPQVIAMKSDPKINSEVPHSDVKEMIQAFAPKVQMQGFTLWAERFGLVRSWFGKTFDEKIRKLSVWVGGKDKEIDSWGGVYTRVMKNTDDSTFGTVEAIKRIGISAERLRYWEQQGIVTPGYVQCGTRRFRRFSESDIKRAILIKMLVDEERYSLEGAIRKLNKKGSNSGLEQKAIIEK